MKNYKTKVNSKNESKEVQELFESLGYEKGACSLGSYPAVIVTTQDWATGNYCSTRALGLDIPAHGNHKEINLPELRDMVVLKRNDVGDATHTDQDDWKWYISSNGDGYVWQCGNAQQLKQWDKASLDLVDLKPIEKKMKEYLIPNRNYEYILTDAREGLDPHAKDWIEIPEWAEFAVLNGDNEINFYTGIGLEKNHFISDAVAWHRPTQPEKLPFIDDEPQSLDDQYAEIEQVRQMEIHGTVEAKPDFNSGAEQASGGAKEKCSTTSSAWDTQIGGVHYKQFKIQPMQFALENRLDAAQQNVIKYIMRHSFKNGKQDLEKAKHYIDLMIEFYYGENNNG